MNREASALTPELHRAACRGVTLLEVLIALIVLSIGLLGLAGLQTVSLQFSTSALLPNPGDGARLWACRSDALGPRRIAGRCLQRRASRCASRM